MDVVIFTIRLERVVPIPLSINDKSLIKHESNSPGLCFSCHEIFWLIIELKDKDLILIPCLVEKYNNKVRYIEDIIKEDIVIKAYIVK